VLGALKRLDNIVFIDIETVSEVESYHDLSEEYQNIWEQKSTYVREKEGLSVEDAYEQKAAIYAEFGRVIVISIGFFVKNQKGDVLFKIKTLANDNEKDLLVDFVKIMKSFKGKLRFCAHNGREFDYPYLCRRFLIHGMSLIKPLKLSDKKPWENPHLDTMQMWKFGDYKHYTSLNVLTTVLGIPSPKQGIDGSQVGIVYYKDRDLERIANYCGEDVIATARVYLRLSESNYTLSSSSIIFAS